MIEPILEVQSLSKRYGDFYANRDVNLQVMGDTVHAVIGPNGAGKTTLFNCLAGATSTSEGRILFEEDDITGEAEHDRPGLGIGRSFQITSLFPELTVLENLRLSGQALNPSRAMAFWHPVPHDGPDTFHAHEVLERLGMSHMAEKTAETLSHGQQRMLEIGMALMARPRLLLLDEPTSGMGVDDIPQVINLIRNLRKICTILLIEHNVGLVSEVCDRVTVLQNGEVIADGTPAEVAANEKVKLAYLGEEL
ncbi:ABC transporter ATP-binding protein [Neptuniibacter halophilus]|uniref:ABC transporter ATP-binding protein n=1 Tax=Neptuniibacter halophilus TaxID=651666 RepID=UPI0025745A02|nr:ABC transporter ATP-binding protein [Neptuniibacter halophilus]